MRETGILRLRVMVESPGRFWSWEGAGSLSLALPFLAPIIHSLLAQCQGLGVGPPSMVTLLT